MKKKSNQLDLLNVMQILLFLLQIEPVYAIYMSFNVVSTWSVKYCQTFLNETLLSPWVCNVNTSVPSKIVTIKNCTRYHFWIQIKIFGILYLGYFLKCVFSIKLFAFTYNQQATVIISFSSCCFSSDWLIFNWTCLLSVADHLQDVIIINWSCDYSKCTWLRKYTCNCHQRVHLL